MPTVVGFVESGCPFPVGFGGFFQTDPNTIYAGTTWEQKKDVFILAAGDTYKAGSTGGETEHVLTVDEMPRHRHSSDDGINGTAVNSAQDKVCTWLNKGSYSNNQPDLGEDGYVKTSWVGGSKPHNNMPPYYTMPFWIRTA